MPARHPDATKRAAVLATSRTLRAARGGPKTGLVSRVTPVHTALRNCTRDEGGPFEVGNQVLISNHRKLLWPKAMVVNVAEKSERDSGRYDWERRAQANRCRMSKVLAAA